MLKRIFPLLLLALCLSCWMPTTSFAQTPTKAKKEAKETPKKPSKKEATKPTKDAQKAEKKNKQAKDEHAKAGQEPQKVNKQSKNEPAREEQKQGKDAKKPATEAAGTAQKPASQPAKTERKSTAPAVKPHREEAPVFKKQKDTNGHIAGDFAANKGRLPIPLTGDYALTTRYGVYTPQGIGGIVLDNKGVNICGRSGAHARSVFAGEVTAVFSTNGFYNVIISHGSYFTVYCNLSSTSVKKGQMVKAEQKIGSIAKDARGYHNLHFQIRHDRTPLNPEQWLEL